MNSSEDQYDDDDDDGDDGDDGDGNGDGDQPHPLGNVSPTYEVVVVLPLKPCLPPAKIPLVANIMIPD